MSICKNCGKPSENTYCGYCGQKTDPERITAAFIWHEVFYFFTHIKKGFLYTSWSMLRSPGKTVMEYIEGKRKNHQSPVSYFLIWTTIFILTLYLYSNIFGENTVIDYKSYFGPGTTTKIVISNLSIFLALLIPFQAFYLYLLVTRIKYNYMETVVAFIYFVGTIILLQFAFSILALIYYLMTSRPAYLGISDIFKFSYFIWFAFHFIKAFPTTGKWWRGIVLMVLAAGSFFLWRLFAVPALVEVFLK